MSEQFGSHYRMKVEGSETIELKEGDIESVVFKCDSQNSTSFKNNKTAIIIGVIGQIVANRNEAETLKLAKWALVPAEAIDVERRVMIELVKANKVVRQYFFSHVFIVDYKECIGEDGFGSFDLILKHNTKGNSNKVELNGGYEN